MWNRIPSFSFALGIIFLVTVACGTTSGSALSGDAGGASSDAASDHPGSTTTDAASDAPSDAIPPADGPFACGSTTCAATEFCHVPCCGGIAPACFPADDAGACPTGSTPDNTCPLGTHCRAAPCTPAPAFCSASPDGAEGCIAGTEGRRDGHVVSCQCG